MPTIVRFNFDRDAVRDYVRGSSIRALQRTGAIGKPIWQQTAPLSNDPRTRGGLRASWYSNVDLTYQAVTLVFGARAPYARFVEFGTAKMPAQAPLRRTAGRLVEQARILLPEELGIV